METIAHVFGNKLRVRSVGVCIEAGQLLLVNHSGMGATEFWSPPGGGIEFKESAEACIEREFLEETGLTVQVCDFLFACEFIKEPLHAIELFFEVKKISGTLTRGVDPEMKDHQIIQQVKFMDWSEIGLMDKSRLHGIFSKVDKVDKIIDLRGYFKL